MRPYINKDLAKVLNTMADSLKCSPSVVLNQLIAYSLRNIDKLDFKKEVIEGSIKITKLSLIKKQNKSDMYQLLFKNNYMRRINAVLFHEKFDTINLKKLRKIVENAKIEFDSYPKDMQKIIKPDLSFIKQFADDKFVTQRLIDRGRKQITIGDEKYG